MKARSRTLVAGLVALFLAAGAGLYAYFGILKSDQRAAAAKEASEQMVAPVEAADGGTALAWGWLKTHFVRYDRLVVTARGETTELGRLPDGAWVISHPFRSRADVHASEDIISTLQALRLNRTIDERPTDEDLAGYGLKPPRFSVTATAEGAPAVTLFGGVENSFDGSLYVQRAGDAHVYAVDGATRTALDKSTEELRARDVLGPRDLGLLGIQLKSARHDWALAREPEHPWAFQKPSGVPADGGAVSGWVAGLAKQRAVKFLVDSPAERKRTGLEKPSVDASFRRQDETVRVRLAAGPSDSDPAFVLREDSFGTTLAELPRTALAALDVPSAELRDRRVLIFEPADVERIRFLPEGGGLALVLQRETAAPGAAPRWLLASRTPQPASGAKVGTLLYALASLKWLPLEEAAPKDPGLGANAHTVVLEDGAGKVLATLVLGKTASRKGPTVWTRSAAGEVVQVDLSRLPALPSRAEDVLDNSPVGPSPEASH